MPMTARFPLLPDEDPAEYAEFRRSILASLPARRTATSAAASSRSSRRWCTGPPEGGASDESVARYGWRGSDRRHSSSDASEG